jgi:hypothetical protein
MFVTNVVIALKVTTNNALTASVTNASVRSSMAASLAAVILDISPWKSRI